MTESSPAHQQVRERTVSEGVVAAIAAREGIDPLDIDRPLHDAIDPDALNALFVSRRTKGYVTFTYFGYEVTIHNDGAIELELDA